MTHTRAIAASELLGPRHECVIPGDFIVFHGLRSSNQRGDEDFVIVDVASDFISFLYDAIDGRRINRRVRPPCI